MIPYVVRTGAVPAAVYELAQELYVFCIALPEYPIGKHPLSCHTVCRFAAERFAGQLQVVDGVFDRLFNHSWLVPTQAAGVIIDLCPVGGGGFLVCDVSFSLSPWKGLYKEEALDLNWEAIRRQVAFLNRQLT